MNVKKIILVSTCMALSTQSFAASTISRGSTQQMDTVRASETDAPTYSKPGELLTRGSGGSCNGDESEGYVPLEFLRNISDGAVRSPNEIAIKEVGSGVYQIEMEKYMRTCTDLEFEVQRVDNDYFVRVKNNFEFNADNVPLEEGESLDKLLPEEKYYRCMNSKGMLKNGAPDWGKAEQTGDIVYSKTSGKFLVDIGDGKESSSLYFGSPKATSYRHLFEANVRSTPEDWNCMTYENFNQAEEKRLYTSVKDDAYDRALKVCETESAEKILDELSKLRSSSAGNFRELENILEKAFNQAADKRAEEIYARMDAIEEEVSRTKDMDEEKASELGREYSDLAKEINKIVIQPSMERVESLIKERKGAKSNEEKTEIDQENQRLQ